MPIKESDQLPAELMLLRCAIFGATNAGGSSRDRGVGTSSCWNDAWSPARSTMYLSSCMEHRGCGIGWMNARDQKNNSTVNVIVSSTCATTDNQVHVKSRSAIVMVSDTLIPSMAAHHINLKGQPHALTGGPLEVHFSNNRIFSARNAKLFPGQLSVGEDFDLVREQALFLAYRIRAMDGREHSSARLAAGGKHSTISAEVLSLKDNLGINPSTPAACDSALFHWKAPALNRELGRAGGLVVVEDEHQMNEGQCSLCCCKLSQTPSRMEGFHWHSRSAGHGYHTPANLHLSEARKSRSTKAPSKFKLFALFKLGHESHGSYRMTAGSPCRVAMYLTYNLD
ncbi:uncharacterized protein BO96DRAFT_433800 [Aspergillus niger CBS 101883]|uniref:uncharacterized protein n=1 Tax=Aspergillus lacticoffeatus (strain CBS 101883) TaxID=1450533 RepID=UPI000D7EE5E3|nr:uncharacterized protein BO96DRAFT_433800 [Aspergillus niger CBS 101883]PYH57004.1 hypothetical protein BO96DRAFT_433800 [Aspergillus niger CBS 101883]